MSGKDELSSNGSEVSLIYLPRGLNDSAISSFLARKVEQGISKSKTQEILNNTLFRACKENDLQYAETLLKAGADPNYMKKNDTWKMIGQSESSSCLSEAATNRSLAMIKVLLKAGASVSFCEEGGGSLMDALLTGPNADFSKEEAMECVEILSSKGADMNMEIFGYAPLAMSIRLHRWNMAKALLEHGADVSWSLNGMTLWGLCENEGESDFGARIKALHERRVLSDEKTDDLKTKSKKRI